MITEDLPVLLRALRATRGLDPLYLCLTVEEVPLEDFGSGVRQQGYYP